MNRVFDPIDIVFIVLISLYLIVLITIGLILWYQKEQRDKLKLEKMVTDREKEIFKYYYYEDLSLSEIGENLNITRTGVFNTLKKVEEKLTQFEASLKLMNIKNTLKGLLDEADIGVIKNKIKKII